MKEKLFKDRSVHCTHLNQNLNSKTSLGFQRQCSIAIKVPGSISFTVGSKFCRPFTSETPSFLSQTGSTAQGVLDSRADMEEDQEARVLGSLIHTSNVAKLHCMLSVQKT